MEKRPTGWMFGSAAITFIAGCASAVVFFFFLLLALNGFMGQERAVNASFATYIILTVATAFLAAIASSLATRFFVMRFSWNAFLAAALSTVVFMLTTIGVHFLCLIVAGIVASELRTGR